jgi:hypothetical protein
MASNFQISTHEKRDSLHLKLYGDFDGSSAYELINALKHCSRFDRIFIDTNELQTIYPFGKDVFQKNIGPIEKKFGNLIFIGEREHNLSLFSRQDF